jgi:hypothetical protein
MYEEIKQIETIAVSQHEIKGDYNCFKGEKNLFRGIRRLLLVANEVDHGPFSCYSEFVLSEVSDD